MNANSYSGSTNMNRFAIFVKVDWLNISNKRKHFVSTQLAKNRWFAFYHFTFFLSHGLCGCHTSKNDMSFFVDRQCLWKIWNKLIYVFLTVNIVCWFSFGRSFLHCVSSSLFCDLLNNFKSTNNSLSLFLLFLSIAISICKLLKPSQSHR